MQKRALALVLTVIFPMVNPQGERSTSPAVEEHILEVIRELPSDSGLRRVLLQGARGNGVHFPWMDDIRKVGIKRAYVWVDIRFDRHGQPKHLAIDRVQYFTQYDFGGVPVSGIERLNVIGASRLEDELNKLALQRAEHGAWLDVPRPRPKPFVGGAVVEFLDDEWLPVAPLMYFAGTPNVQ